MSLPQMPIVKKKKSSDESPIHFATIEEKYDMINRAHHLQGMGDEITY